jgi:hypothetical protein
MCLAGHGIRATYSDSISRQQTEQPKNAEVMSRVYPGDWVCIRLRSALLLANKPSRSPRHARGVAIGSGGAGTRSPDLPSSRSLALQPSFSALMVSQVSVTQSCQLLMVISLQVSSLVRTDGRRTHLPSSGGCRPLKVCCRPQDPASPPHDLVVLIYVA